MNGPVAWIAAAAEDAAPIVPRGERRARDREEERKEEHEIGLEGMAAHNFPSAPVSEEEGQAEAGNPDLRQYRGRTAAMLRRYMKFSLDVGRVPSLLGREFFRARVTRYSVSTFEDRVIFVHDMEQCLERLGEESRKVLARVILQEYQRDEAARVLRWGERTVYRKLVEALDTLSEILLAAGLLEAMPRGQEKTCQEGEEGDFLASDWNDEK